ncbi:MAG: ATP-binding protein [Oscillospiraceae bacterium]
MFFIFIIIFSIVFFLYNLTLEPIFYSCIICLVFTFIILIIQFLKFYNKHTILKNAQKTIGITKDQLPPPKNIIEEDYQNIITCLFEDKMQTQSSFDNKMSSMIDYYTLWVHQIKTPISAMQILIQSDKNEYNIKYNQTLFEELFKITQYSQMVLSYLRLEDGTNDLVIKKYSLEKITNQAVKKYADTFILKKIILEYNVENINVLTDEKWLVFVVEQILSNALKYTKTGKIKIYSQDSEKIIIEDSGIGIAPEDIPRIFEKGYTGYNGRYDKKSTGIGLYLCKKVLDKLGSTIYVQSKIGYGTKVIIDLSTKEIKE